MRETVARDNFVARAIERVLQWVASGGVDSRVRVIRPSTCASVISRGAPGRGSSARPSSRAMRNRSRHLHTVAPVILSSRATAWLERPSAQRSTMRDRRAKRWAVFGRRAHCSNFTRSSWAKSKGFLGRPVRMDRAYQDALT